MISCLSVTLVSDDIFFNIFFPQRIPIIFWRWELQVKTSQRTSKIQFPVDLRLWKRMWRERLVTVSSAHWAENSWTTVKRCIQSEHVLLKSNTVLSNAFAEVVWGEVGEVNGWDGERKGCKRMGRDGGEGTSLPPPPCTPQRRSEKKPNYLVIHSTNVALQFLWNLTSLVHLTKLTAFTGVHFHRLRNSIPDMDGLRELLCCLSGIYSYSYMLYFKDFK